MAYYGGTANERPWPKLDMRVALGIFLIVVSWAALGYVFLKDLVAPTGPHIVTEATPGALVLVANSDIAAGDRIDAALLKREPFSGDIASARPLEELELGRVSIATRDIPAGTVLTAESVRTIVPTSAITAKIPEGFRAVTISVDAESGVEGWVRPGTRVDVVWTTMHLSRPAVTTIVQSAEVLSAERSLEPAKDERSPATKVPSHVTLLVSSKDAQKVQLAKSSGSLSLILRGDEDTSVASNEMLSASNLLKSSGIDAAEERQGTVRFDKREFEVRGGKLIKVAPAGMPATTEGTKP